MDIELRNLWSWLLWVISSTLSLGLSFALGGWIAGAGLETAYTFDMGFPDARTTLLAGLVLGFVQWQFVKERWQRFLVQWTMGSTIGVFLISGIGLLYYSAAIWTHFKELLTPAENIAQIARSAALGGLFGGAILGAIQGRSWFNGLAWSLVNAVAWAGGWAIGRTVTRLVSTLNYWELEGLSESSKLAIQLGVMGVIAGLVSSSITGIFFLKLFPRSN